jgi:hypothetical protein
MEHTLQELEDMVVDLVKRVEALEGSGSASAAQAATAPAAADSTAQVQFADKTRTFELPEGF